MDRGEVFRTLWTNPIGIRAMLWAKLPLAAFAGLRVQRLDENGAEVTLPAGWKTQNPFRSTYFAAQAMAAEMSTGAPALYFIEQSGTHPVLFLNQRYVKGSEPYFKSILDTTGAVQGAEA